MAKKGQQVETTEFFATTVGSFKTDTEDTNGDSETQVAITSGKVVLPFVSSFGGAETPGKFRVILEEYK